MSWKTINARRPDLEALEVNAPINYIGNRIYPVIFRKEKTGTLYYTPAVADLTAQTGRKGSGASFDKTKVKSGSVNYSCGAYYARPAVEKEEAANLGGVEVSDRIGGTLAIRAVMAKVEADQAAKLFTGDGHAVTDGGLFDAIAEGCAAVKKVYGRTALVMGLDEYRYLMNMEEVTSRLAFTGLTPAERVRVLSLQPELLRDMCQQVFGVDEILVGDPDIWSTGDLAGKAAIAKLPDPEDLSYKLNPELGKTVSYQIDGKYGYEVESAVDEVEQENIYTATAYTQVVEFNSTGKYILTGLKAKVES